MFRVHRSEIVVSSSLVSYPFREWNRPLGLLLLSTKTRLQYSRFAGGSRLCLIIFMYFYHDLLFDVCVNVRLIVSRVCTFEWKVCITVCATVYARGGCADGGDVTGHRVKGQGNVCVRVTVSPAAVQTGL